jgi:hypothetical protein
MSVSLLILLIIKTITMDEYKTLLEVVDTSDADALKNMQKKINQWTTAKTLRKFTTLSVGGSMVLFTILTLKAGYEKIS